MSCGRCRRSAFRTTPSPRCARENLARWPTGKDVDLDEAAALHRALPKHKQLAWVLRRAVEEGRCLTQPRGGFGTFALQLELMETLDKEGLADVVPDDDRQLHAQRALRRSRSAASRNRSARAGPC